MSNEIETKEMPADIAASDSTATSDVTAKTPAAESSANDSSSSQKIVRTLAIGQEVKGIVKRTSEFGAFIDIGVGRDGLVHISELSTRRIAKVSDVLSEGQEATFWIKELDRDRNRISLTMIEPGIKTLRTMQKGDLVNGTVTRIMPYGVFVDIGIGRDALLHVREMSERFTPKPEEVVKVGEAIEARIIEIERRRARVDLSIKGLRAEPEPEPEPVVIPAVSEAAKIEAEEEVAMVDKFADMPAMTAIELAYKKAMGEFAKNKVDKAKKAGVGQTHRAMQEDILSRTLKQR
jgi:ribosomal protein S1